MPVRFTTAPVAVKLAVIAVFVLLTCAACATGPAQPSLARCTSFGLQAIRSHTVVHAVPAACAGLSHEQVNTAVAKAIRAAVGSRPKAPARQLAAQDGKYLAPLITSIPPPPPVAVTTGSAPASSGTELSLFALGCWVLTASAGSYLVFRTRIVRRRRGRWSARASLGTIIAMHVGAALACVATLAAFAVTGARAVGWVAAALVITAAGFGMATLVTALPDPVASTRGARAPAAGSARRQQSIVAVIALHGVLATVTILLVWLAVVSS
jgi:hypothetical protein